MSLGLLITAALVFARMGGVLSVMPGIGSSSSPQMVRLLVAVALTILITPTVPAYPHTPSLQLLAVSMVSEVVLGLMMGGAVSLVFGGLAFGMEIIGAQTGRAVALQFNPLMEVSQGPIGALSGMMATLVFLGMDLHLLILLILTDSFHTAPPGSSVDLFQAAEVLTSLAAPTLAAGLKLAGPVLVMVFLINCFIAVLARLAPNMNVFFSIGFIITMMVGMLLTYLSFPQLIDAHLSNVLDVIERLPEMYASPT